LDEEYKKAIYAEGLFKLKSPGKKSFFFLLQF